MKTSCGEENGQLRAEDSGRENKEANGLVAACLSFASI
jgi:hypothetical protein